MPGDHELTDQVIAVMQSAESPLSLAEIRARLLEAHSIDVAEAKRITGRALLHALESHPKVETMTIAVEDPSRSTTRRLTSSSSPKFGPQSTSVKKFLWIGQVEGSVDPVTEDSQAEGDAAADTEDVETGPTAPTSLDDLVAVLVSGDQTGDSLDFDNISSILGTASDKQLGKAADALRDSGSVNSLLVLLAAPRRSRTIEKAIVTWAENDGTDAAMAGVISWL